MRFVRPDIRHFVLTTALSAAMTLIALPLGAQNIFPPTGDVGIGTTSPGGALHILESGAPPAGLPAASNGLLLGIESPSGYKWIQSYGGVLTLNSKGNSVAIGRTTATHKLDVEGAARVRTDGANNVLISGQGDDVFFDLIKDANTTPSARIELEGFTDPTRHEGEIAFFTRRPVDASLKERMRIRADGLVNIGGKLIVGPSTVDIINPVFATIRPYSRSHACIFPRSGNAFEIADCMSDAEYIQSIDTGEGPLETGDLVSLADPELTSGIGASYAVVRSSEACDSTLIGFISDPQYGASGKRVDESSIPLATTGFFPVKVTMENGPIRRGDAITSSSIPGWGMRSTGGCRVVGYALEDAEKDGYVTIRAELGDQGSDSVLVEDLVRRIDKLEARLAELE